MNSKELKSKVVTLGNKLAPRIGRPPGRLRGSLGNRQGRDGRSPCPGRYGRNPAGGPLPPCPVQPRLHPGMDKPRTGERIRPERPGRVSHGERGPWGIPAGLYPQGADRDSRRPPGQAPHAPPAGWGHPGSAGNSGNLRNHAGETPQAPDRPGQRMDVWTANILTDVPRRCAPGMRARRRGHGSPMRIFAVWRMSRNG